MWFSPEIQHTTLPSNHDRKLVPVFRSGGINGALLTDLPKAFGSLLHNLLLPNLLPMVLTVTLWSLCKATSLKGNKEAKLTTFTTFILAYNMVFHKVLY